MESTRKIFVGGNWKSNNTLAQTNTLVDTVLTKLEYDPSKIDVVVSPPFVHLTAVHQKLKNTNVLVAAQNVSLYKFGAFTGQVTAEHIKDLGINWAIIGHSERRTLFGESDQIVSSKVEIALKNGLSVIACFGQTLQERQENHTIQVVKRQLNAIRSKVNAEQWSRIVLAYEPVWAIGTGKVATTEQVNQIHTWIRSYLQQFLPSAFNTIRIIYGGSVTDKNCVELIKIKDVDGFLVGGASLKPAFIDIVKSYAHKN